jgi:hypothetical protein
MFLKVSPGLKVSYVATIWDEEEIFWKLHKK